MTLKPVTIGASARESDRYGWTGFPSMTWTAHQADCCGLGGEEETATLTQSDAKTILGRANGFVDEARAGKIHDEVDLSTEISGLSRSLYDGAVRPRVSHYLVSDSKLSESKTGPKAKSRSPRRISHLGTSPESIASRNRRRGETTSKSILQYHERWHPCWPRALYERYKADLCVIPAKVLADLYNEYGFDCWKECSLVPERGRERSTKAFAYLGNEPDHLYLTQRIAAV